MDQSTNPSLSQRGLELVAARMTECEYVPNGFKLLQERSAVSIAVFHQARSNSVRRQSSGESSIRPVFLTLPSEKQPAIHPSGSYSP